MAKSIVVEGKTTNEAIESGLKKLKVSKNMVDIKVLEEEKKSFFSILTPRVVKVELTVKEGLDKKEATKKNYTEKKQIELTSEDISKAKESLETFLKSFKNVLKEGLEYKIKENKEGIDINIKGENIGFLIGYRGETLYAFQNILSSIANKNTKNRVRIFLDIEGYKKKREKTLENLAERLATKAIKTGKSVTLEPMQPYERKIIHSKLQENSKVSTNSIGEEPRRRIVISLNK